MSGSRPPTGRSAQHLGIRPFVFDFDWLDAEREFLTAIELSPGSAEAHESLLLRQWI